MTTDLHRRMVLLLPRLRAFALSLSRSRTDADDLVQAACVRALASLSTFQDGTNFDAWMMRILRNLWIDQCRQRRGHTSFDVGDNTHHPAGEDGRAIAEARLELGDTQAAMAALPEDQRSVLVLVCVNGMTYREAAEVLEIPAGTVMSRLSRARQNLHKALHGEEGEGGHDLDGAQQQGRHADAP